DGIVDDERAADLKKQSSDWVSWDLTERQLCDLELLLSGGFSPLRGFMGKADYERVRAEIRLADGTLWPIPIMLDVTEETAAAAEGGPRAVRALGVAQGRRVPDAQPDAPRALRADAARGARGGGVVARASGRRDDEARRRGPLHAGAVLPRDHVVVPARDGDAVPVAARDADA